jgi:hypothetical protein
LGSGNENNGNLIFEPCLFRCIYYAVHAIYENECKKSMKHLVFLLEEMGNYLNEMEIR